MKNVDDIKTEADGRKALAKMPPTELNAVMFVAFSDVVENMKSLSALHHALQLIVDELGSRLPKKEQSSEMT